MKNELQRDILRIGHHVREFLLEQAKLKFTWATNLRGACAVGATLCTEQLRNELKLPHVDLVLREGYSGDHCWTEIWVDSAKWILDVTATQFAKHIDRVLLERYELYTERPFFEDLDGKQFINDDALSRYDQLWSEVEHPATYRDLFKEFKR